MYSENQRFPNPRPLQVHGKESFYVEKWLRFMFISDTCQQVLRNPQPNSGQTRIKETNETPSKSSFLWTFIDMTVLHQSDTDLVNMTHFKSNSGLWAQQFASLWSIWIICSLLKPSGYVHYLSAVLPAPSLSLTVRLRLVPGSFSSINSPLLSPWWG